MPGRSRFDFGLGGHALGEGEQRSLTAGLPSPFASSFERPKAEPLVVASCAILSFSNCGYTVLALLCCDVAFWVPLLTLLIHTHTRSATVPQASRVQPFQRLIAAVFKSNLLRITRRGIRAARTCRIWSICEASTSLTMDESPLTRTQRSVNDGLAVSPFRLARVDCQHRN